MDKVSVYFFDGWDGPAGENKRSLRMATIEAIKSRGTPILETQRTVNKSDLDGGFFPKPGIWIVEIFDVVSRVEGRSRVSVPHGEYLMRERSTESYWLTNQDLLPVGFELTLTEVATYLQGKMRIIAGKWP
jgi:hypothetical protein